MSENVKKKNQVIEVDNDGEKVKPSKEKTVEEKLQEAEEKQLRSLAEIENQRRRFEKEVRDAYEFGSFNFAKESLAILDNLQRAKLAIKNDESLKDNKDLNKFIENLTIIEKDLISVPSVRGSRYFGPSKMSFFNLLKHSLSIISVFRGAVLIRSTLFIIVYILMIKSNATIITALPLFLLLVMIYSIFSLALRENMDEFDKSLENISNIDTIK